MSRTALVLSALFLLTPVPFTPVLITAATAAQTSAANPPAQKNVAYAAIPVGAAKEANPVKSSPESIAHGKKWWGVDCAMCHGKDGNGKGETAKEMKLQVSDFTDPATLKDRTDGEIFYVIKNGHQDMPGEGTRLKPEDYWDLVNYVRSLAKVKASAEAKPQ